MLKLAGVLNADVDVLVRHHVVELYSSGLDKLAQEVRRLRFDQFQ